MYIQVAINIPVDNPFSYAVPPELEPKVAVGKRVLVPFGKKKVTGYVLSILPETDREDVRPILSVLDESPLFNSEDLQFFQWASDYYLYPLGRLLKEVLPGGIDSGSQTWVVRRDDAEAPMAGLSPPAMEIFERVCLQPHGMRLKALKEAFSGRRIDTALKRLETAGLIVLEERLQGPVVSLRKVRFVSAVAEKPSDKTLTPKQRDVLTYLREHGEVAAAELNVHFKGASAVIAALQKKGLVTAQDREIQRSADQEGLEGLPDGVPILNPDQETAYRSLTDALATGAFSPWLLHGVTGSGKTEVYLRAIEEALRQNGSAIYLVPEIALTPQLLGRVQKRFADLDIAVMHSGISEAARYDQWRRIAHGDLRLIIGARSAIFAPARHLKLIIVDEEHDSSYKQDDRMRYHARDLAIIKASRQSAVVVLGSATPAVQSYHNALGGKYRYLCLPKRVAERPLPVVHPVDMKMEFDPEGKPRLLSRPLLAAIGETLDQGKQTILFLNRRGFHTFVSCYDCGHVFRCLNCSVALTHHAVQGVLRCHYCDFSLKSLPLCPSCNGSRIGTFGVGTERLEKEVAERFPGARVERMDSDTTSEKGHYEKILNRFSRGEIDILIGTQMITKGHDYPGVLLVGIISADAALNLPDFRSAEKAFQVLTQVAGRGGRGDDPGRVYIQTFNPEHYAIDLAARHDYRGFYEQEIALRQEFAYPPFTRMVSLQISSNVREKAVKVAEEIGKAARRLAAGAGIDIMGPAEAPIARIKGKHRRHLLLKGASSQALHSLIRTLLKANPVRDVTIKVDFDPVNFM